MSRSELVRRLAVTPGAVFFGAPDPVKSQTGPSFLGLFPWLEIKGFPAGIKAVDRLTGERETADEPVSALDRWIGRLKNETGGRGILAGYLAYEFARRLEPSLDRLPLRSDAPEFHLVFPSLVLSFDGERMDVQWTPPSGRSAKIAETRAVVELERRLSLDLQGVSLRPLSVFTSPGFDSSREDFIRMVRRAKDAIAEGEVYQANLSHSLTSFGGSSPECAWSLYEKLCEINPSPYACWLNLDPVRHIGSSPELLAASDGRILQTRPIAGTRPRRAPGRRESELRVELLLNEKERAEHLMLVDLERNDLGRVCRAGTVRADEFMTVEAYSHVIHIVSNVSGELKPEAGPMEQMAALFPGGTITGVPKIRCMRLIGELEGGPRGLYTGSAGYFGMDGSMEWNIIIRSIEQRGSRYRYQVGAGIVADSDPEKEWEETLQKGRAMGDAIGHFVPDAGRSPA